VLGPGAPQFVKRYDASLRTELFPIEVCGGKAIEYEQLFVLPPGQYTSPQG